MTTPNYPYGDPGSTGGDSQGNSGGTPDYGSYNDGGFAANYSGGFENSPMNATKNQLAGWALGLGIASLAVYLTVFTGPLAVLILTAPFIAVAGIIVAIVALIKGKRYEGSNRRTGWSIGGLIMSIISLVITAFLTILVVVFLNSGILDCFVDNPDADSQQACVEEFMNDNF